MGGGEDGEGDVEGEGMGESSLDRTGDAEAGTGGEGGVLGEDLEVCVREEEGGLGQVQQQPQVLPPLTHKRVRASGSLTLRYALAR